MDWIGEALKEYDILVVALLWFGYTQVWPWLRDKLYPAHITTAKEDRSDRRRRDGQIFDLIRQSTAAFTSLEKTIETCNVTLSAGHVLISQQVLAQTQILLMISENVAGLYGLLGAHRPKQAPNVSPAAREAP